MKKKTIKNWEFLQEKGGRNKHSKIWGGGKNKHFWTEYSPLDFSPDDEERRKHSPVDFKVRKRQRFEIVIWCIGQEGQGKAGRLRR